MGVRVGSKVMKWVSGKKRLEGSKGGRRGYVPVRVGMDEASIRRFMVHTKALRDERFCELLSKSTDEYGFSNDGVLRILHEPHAFEDWILTTSYKPPTSTSLITSLLLRPPPCYQFFNKLRARKFN